MENKTLTPSNLESQLNRRQALLLGGITAMMLAGCSSTEEANIAVSSSAPTPSNPEMPQPLFGPDTSRRDTPFSPKGYGATRPAGLLDAVKMREAGIAYHIAKASRGYLDTDLFPWREPNFKESRQRADDAGLLFGAFHFLDEGHPVDQAQAFVERLEETGGVQGIMHMVDFERYVGDGSRGNKAIHDPAYEDLLQFVAAHQFLTGGHPLGVYSANWYWGGADITPTIEKSADSKATNAVLNNPPAPDGTYLWWSRILRPYPGMRKFTDYQAELLVDESHRDPWITERLGTYHDYVFRQFVICEKSTGGGALLQQFNGSTAKNGHLMSLDMNVSYKPYDHLLSLAGLPPGKLQLPESQEA